MDVLLLDQNAVARLIDPRELLDELADGFRSLSAGKIVAPTRVEVAVEKGFSLSMPAYRPGGHIGVKVINDLRGQRVARPAIAHGPDRAVRRGDRCLCGRHGRHRDHGAEDFGCRRVVGSHPGARGHAGADDRRRRRARANTPQAAAARPAHRGDPDQLASARRRGTTRRTRSAGGCCPVRRSRSRGTRVGPRLPVHPLRRARDPGRLGPRRGPT